MTPEVCTWCGMRVDLDGGYRLAEEAGERRAAFCRLEHVVPWAIRGAHWEAGTIAVPRGAVGLERCARCEAELDDTRLVLVHNRGEFRVTDAFCGVPHLLEWARAGGHWG